MAEKIRHQGDKYQELFDEAYKHLNDRAFNNVRGALSSGLSGFTGMVGNLLNKTPIGDLTPIDDGLLDMSNAVAKNNEEEAHRIIESFLEYKSYQTGPFIEHIEFIDQFENNLHFLIPKDDNLYLVPGIEQTDV